MLAGPAKSVDLELRYLTKTVSSKEGLSDPY
jgi:hypothetical protein